MKKKLLYCLCCTALFIGCSTEPELMDVVTPQGTPQIKISGTINQTYTTRVDDGGFCDGDQIGLYGVNYSENNTVAGDLLDEGNQVDNARYTFDEANWQWVSSGSIYYKDAETNIDLYAYYPYGTVNSVSGYAFEVQQDQSGANIVDGYAQSDFLWGKTENVTPSEEKVKIKFNHRMACANVVLTQGEGFAEGEFDALEKSVLTINTTRKAIINLQTGEVIATGEAESEGIVMKSNEEGFRAIVVPQTVEAGKALFSITVNGITYRYKMSDTAVDYQAGKQTKFTIKINKKSHSGEYEFSLVDCQIIDWIADLDTHGGEARQYYVVHQEEPGTLSAKLRAAKKNPARIKSLKISGKIDACDFYFMRDSMEILKAVNLKESTIEATTKASWYNNGQTTSEDHKDNQDTLQKYPANEIPSDAFKSKISLTNFTFPEVVTKIQATAFYGTTLAGALIIPNDVTEIGGSAFSRTAITSLRLSNNLKILGGSVFSDCEYLTGSLTLPNTLESIGKHCFDSCVGINGQLVLSSKLKEIPQNCFYDCRFSGDLVIPEGVESIGFKAFMNNVSIPENRGTLQLPSSLKSIDSQAFYKGGFQGELIIPALIQKLSDGCFAYNNFTSLIFDKDSQLTVIEGGTSAIEPGAFLDCHRICNHIEFPKNLTTIGANAFSACITIPSITLPASLVAISRGAFSGCPYLNSIVCEANEPPTIASSTFAGVAKDNFTVEVPERSVNLYQSDVNWGEFKRIEAHYDFSISRRLMRVLNAEHSRTFVLRVPANFAWSIESCPEWITVTPSSGVGKTEITVTVAKMMTADAGTFEINIGSYNNPTYETHNGRAGEIVFLLNDKDYRTTMDVEQYDYEYGDGEVITNQTATIGNGVNIVFMGDCFDARDIANGSYLKGVSEAIGYYFDIEPYKTYKEYFNVYTIVGMSNDSGMGTVNTIRDAKFGSQYTLSEGITPDHATIYEYAMKSETVNEANIGQTLVVLVENTTDYGGICYMWDDGSAIACCPMSDDTYPYDFRGIVQHEAGGHGFGKLADEYIYSNAFVSSCPCTNPHLGEFLSGKQKGWFRNLEHFGDMDKVGWSHLIFNPTYSNIVDIYEGGFYHTRGIFRSEPNSCMNNNIPYYSAISRQEIVERIMRYAGKEFDINEFYANDVLDIQGNKSAQATAAAIPTAVTLTGAGKQMPPKYMGESPFEK